MLLVTVGEEDDDEKTKIGDFKVRLFSSRTPLLAFMLQGQFIAVFSHFQNFSPSPYTTNSYLFLFMKLCFLRTISYCFICFYFSYSKEWQCPDPPRLVLDRLEDLGYKVIAVTGVGQTCIWTLHKEKNPTDDTKVKL